MNQAGNTETLLAPPGTTPQEVQHFVDANHGQPASYIPSLIGSETPSWTTQSVDNGSAQNGYPPNATYSYQNHAQLPTAEGVNGTATDSSSSVASTSVPQDYSSYPSYQNSSTDSYGYGTTGYTSYYSGYQQQTSHSYSQPVAAYPNTGHPYQPISSFQNTGSYAAPANYSSTYYNPGDYQTSAGYPTTNYSNPTTTQWNEGNYANYGSYQYSNYNPTSTGTYGSASAPAAPVNYQPQHTQYYGQSHTEVTCAPGTENLSVATTAKMEPPIPGIPGVTGGYSSTISQPQQPPQTQHLQQPQQPQYPQQAQQPQYSQQAQQPQQPPQTQHLQQPQQPQYPQQAQQPQYSQQAQQPQYSQQAQQPQYSQQAQQPQYPQQPSAVSWMPETSSFQLPPQQPSTVVNAANDSQWNYGSSGFQSQQPTVGKPEGYQPYDARSAYASFPDQQNHAAPGPQGTNLQYLPAHQVPQNNPFPNTHQTSPSLDSRRVSKFQIQTNPRIVSNMGLGFAKTEKASSGTSAATKPAYISVSLPNPNDKVLSNDTSDSALKSGAFPKSLRGYVERALSRCKDETQVVASQAVMKEMITSATADGTLYTRDWDTEPLFPLPRVDGASKEEQFPALASTFKRSPTRRVKSRWEPIPEEKPQDKLAHVGVASVKYGGWRQQANQREKKPFGVDSENKDRMNSMKFSNVDQNVAKFKRPFKKQRLTHKATDVENGDASSDSDKEQSLSSFYSVSSMANTPEERKRRENRSKRFEKGQGNRTELNHYHKPKGAGVANVYARRATAMVISKNLDSGGSEAVEDMDWDALTVKGTCQEIEKRYLRLTSAPDPATVRPEEVLEKALAMVQNSQKNYLYKCDQLKSIRQDLTVQRIRNQLTAKVYETHGRLALEYGDLHEYNQCQSQLKTLYAEGIEGCHMEFSAYGLLIVILHSNNYRDLLSLMARLPRDAKEDEAVKHALAVRAAVTSGNYIMFFRLYRKAPNLNSCLMDLYVEKMRYKAVSCISKSYRPTVPVSYISQVLGFASASSENDDTEGKETGGLGECLEWLKAHGACLITDSNGEMQLDAKASSSSLYIPEPEDAVAHGDANLAVNDFLARASS